MSNEVPTKFCSRGKHEVPLTQFSVHGGRRAPQAWCKHCMREYSRARYAAKKAAKVIDTP